MAKDLILKNELFDFLGLTNNIGSGVGSHFKVDIIENANNYLLEAELPGVQKSDITIDFHNDVLSIEVTRESKQTERIEGSNVLVRERSYGKVSRQFAIRDVDAENVAAQYEAGILTITLPKYSKAKQRNKIEVK